MKDTITADMLLDIVRQVGVPACPPRLTFRVVDSWLSGYRWVDGGPCRQPPPRGERKGTRRQWKRRNNRNAGWRRRWVHIEPDHAMRTNDGTVYCTARQYAAIKADSRLVAQPLGQNLGHPILF